MQMQSIAWKCNIFMYSNSLKAHRIIISHHWLNPHLEREPKRVLRLNHCIPVAGITTLTSCTADIPPVATCHSSFRNPHIFFPILDNKKVLVKLIPRPEPEQRLHLSLDNIHASIFFCSNTTCRHYFTWPFFYPRLMYTHSSQFLTNPMKFVHNEHQTILRKK